MRSFTLIRLLGQQEARCEYVTARIRTLPRARSSQEGESVGNAPRGGAPPLPVPAGLALFFRGNVVRRKSEDRRRVKGERAQGGNSSNRW